MGEKVCKKCGRPLSENYKYKQCESCRNNKVDKMKRGLKGAAGVAGLIALGVAKVLSSGKDDSEK